MHSGCMRLGFDRCVALMSIKFVAGFAVVDEETAQSEDRDQRWGAVRWGVALVLMMGFFIPFPNPGPTGDMILDSAHIFVFAAIAFFLMRAMMSSRDWRVAAVVSIAASTAAGIVVELVQHFVGRKPSLHDVWTDFWGSIAGTSAAIAASSSAPPRRVFFGLITIVAICVAGLGIYRF